MRFRRNKKNRIISVLDTTPLVNVVYLLLIFFLLSTGLPLRISESNLLISMSGSGGTTAGSITIVILPEQIIIDGKPASEQGLAGLPRDRDIVILASRDITYIKVITILDVLRVSGHTRLSLATKPIQE
jgi:biopolymer transport protein ExbD